MIICITDELILKHMIRHKNKKWKYCNNCGLQGHIYRECNKPISSFGIICFKTDNSINLIHTVKTPKILMIRRKDSIGYIEFMRGRYDLNQKNHILNLINEMTIDEKNRILEKDFETLWNDLWCCVNNQRFRKERIGAEKKLLQLREGVEINNTHITLKELVNKSSTNWIEPEWGFPKGRRNNDEYDMYAACREFSEETGIHNSNIELVLNLQPYTELFMGSNFKCYRHIYYLAKLKDENVYNNELDKQFQYEEVSNMGWFSFEECIEKMRTYSYKKKQILVYIKTIFDNYDLCQM